MASQVYSTKYTLKKKKKRTYTNSSETLPKDWRGGNNTLYEETDHPDSKTKHTTKKITGKDLWWI